MIEIGLESSLLDELISGQKLVEARLSKGKFKDFQIGDNLTVRRDIWENGRIVSSIPDVAFVKIIGILPFASFREMLKQVGHKRVVPIVSSEKKALNMYRQFYSEDDEKQHGVLAFELMLLGVNKT